MKRIKEILPLAFWSLVGLSSHTYAQASLSADTIELGGQTTLTVKLSQHSPTPDMLTANTIEVVGEQTFDTANHTQKTVLTSFEPGVHYVILGEDDSLPLVVKDVAVDTSAKADIKDIANIELFPHSFWEIARWILLGLGVIAAALGAWWIFNHRKKIQEVLTPHEPQDMRSPEERALDTLEEIRKKQLWQSGLVKEYHTELTDTVRRFIEESTGIHATEMTSEECLNALMCECMSANTPNTQAIKQSSIQSLKDIFTTADLVKFAKSVPQPYEHERSMSQSVEFVKMFSQTMKSQEDKQGEEKEVTHA